MYSVILYSVVNGVSKKSPERITARHHHLSEMIFRETSAEIADGSFDKKVSIKTRRSSAPFIILMLTLDSHVHRWEDTSLSIVIVQHTTVLMIGIATYPHATFGFSITFSIVLHLEHIMVLPRYPSSATLKMIVCLSFGSPLHISVLPQPGTGQRAIGMRFVSLFNKITSPDILYHLQSDSLYRQLLRIEIQLGTRVCLVLRVEAWFAVFPE